MISRRKVAETWAATAAAVALAYTREAVDALDARLEVAAELVDVARNLAAAARSDLDLTVHHAATATAAAVARYNRLGAELRKARTR